MRQNYSVALYFCDREFGGREEGGWYYDTGKIVKMIRVFNVEEKAITYANRMQRLVDRTLNKGRRPISSVLSTGRYDVQVHDGLPPKYYPETRPHYE
jgi:hypothetical protein